jgi:uncharacterized protein (UPF0261 family)
MDDPRKAARRELLQRLLARSQRVQRRLILVVPLGAAATAIAAAVFPLAVPFVVVTALAYWGVGRYITAVHMAETRQQLRELDRPPAPIEGRERD